ncbi:MAG: M3 family oligoendopeptidase [Gemmatimonadales bacterium]|nr:M3 family oligoendopeptidase [Gemmatimonadales bacterium]
MTRSLPRSSDALADATWDDIRPWFDELERRPLDAAAMPAWLADWSLLESLVMEAASRAMIRYTVDTRDAAAEVAYRRFSTTILPPAEERSVALQKRLVASGYVAPDLDTTIRRFRTSIEIFREANVPLQSELEELGATYQKLTGGMLAEWDGARLPLPQLQPFLKATDRAVRERAWRAWNAPYVAAHDELESLFDRMLALRQQVARNAGFANYRDYVFPAKYRFDYTPDDCARFHDAVARRVMPAYERLMAHRRAQLGLDALRPWDLSVELHGGEPVRPFADGRELAERSRAVFQRVDPGLGREFGVMHDEALLDLDSREGKAPGGYCDTLHVRGRPFIFMNAVGLVDDVNTLLHEAGHAFHAFAAHHHPLVWQRHPGSEMAELASMSMELLAAPHLRRPDGFFEGREWRRSRLEHLEDVIITLAHVASIDAFQHWIYTDPAGGDAAARDAAWLRIRARFDRGVDWAGLERERVARWLRQLHVFLYPFYYIEYAIAQLGALQVWRNSLRDPAEAVRRYREALALGATRPLPELYAAAGVRLAFDEATIGELVELVEAEMARLRDEEAAAG